MAKLLKRLHGICFGFYLVDILFLVFFIVAGTEFETLTLFMPWNWRVASWEVHILAVIVLVAGRSLVRMKQIGLIRRLITIVLTLAIPGLLIHNGISAIVPLLYQYGIFVPGYRGRTIPEDLVACILAATYAWVVLAVGLVAIFLLRAILGYFNLGEATQSAIKTVQSLQQNLSNTLDDVNSASKQADRSSSKNQNNTDFSNSNSSFNSQTSREEKVSVSEGNTRRSSGNHGRLDEQLKPAQVREADDSDQELYEPYADSDDDPYADFDDLD